MKEVSETTRPGGPGTSSMGAQQGEADLRDELSLLREHEQEHQAIVDAAVDAIVTIDEHGRIRSVNPATTQMFGWSREELIGKSVGILMPPPHRQAHDGYVRRYCETRIPRIVGSRVEVVGQRKDGSLVPIELSLSEVTNGALRFTAILRDLSERKQMEEEIFQAQKLEAIGRLSNGIAHEFNNLLMGIIGCCNMVESELGDAGGVHRHLADMKAAAHRGGALTQQLLIFGCKRPGERVPTSLDEVIRSSERMLSQLLGADIEIETHLCPSGAWMQGDASRLEQVLANLAVNAREAMPGGGRLRFQTRDLELGKGEPLPGPLREIAGDGHLSVLSVSDTGAGMTPETLSRAFEPFFSTKPAGEGTGLGLSTVYGIVQELGGYINVESAPGAGTTFTLFFPAVEPPAEESAESAPTSLVAGRGEVILLVEDDLLVRRSVQYYLTRLGYEVLVAADPPGALSVLEEHGGPVQLLVTDMVMPHMSGAELAVEIRARYPDVRVLVMSAHSAASLQRQGRLESDQAFLEKPFDLEELAPVVRRVLDEVPPPLQA
jgi:PAS domain S-box-containing protein